MAAHPAHTIRLEHAGVRNRPSGATLARVGALAGVAGGLVMAMWQMVVGAVAQEPTAVAGIDSSFWTAVTSIPSVIFGTDWFHGSFDFGALFVGLMGHMMNSAVLGVGGVAIASALFGARPRVSHALVFGMMFGLILELVIVNLVVNQVQTIDTLYTSTPEWSWWVAHAMFGATVGLVGAGLLGRRGA
jgi:hypothetical protein